MPTAPPVPSRPPSPRPPFLPKGELKVWLTASGLAVGLLMITGLLALVAWNGLAVFWPRQVPQFEVQLEDGSVQSLAGTVVKNVERKSLIRGETLHEVQIYTGNRDVYRLGFRFLNRDAILSSSIPTDLVVAERTEYGNAIFRPVRLQFEDGKTLEYPTNPEAFTRKLDQLIREGNARRDQIERLERGDIGDINARLRKLEIQSRKVSDEQRSADLRNDIRRLNDQFENLAKTARSLRAEQDRILLTYRLPSSEEQTQPVSNLISFHQPNQLNFWERLGLFGHRIWRFITEEPREANTEGGVFPAIFGTFVMTILMAAMVTPLGVIAAIYLREYAKQGLVVGMVRICINNLAGVPSIVFGVFGLGFFIYGVGSFVDGGPSQPLPAPWWYAVAIGSIVHLTAALLVSSRNRTAGILRKAKRSATVVESILWVITLSLVVLTVVKCPYFHGFFNDQLPSPTFGTGGILWASVTLALMTLPVVIVATEEALAAVPMGIREAALACGASKWQMIQRIALPSALPGVMTGVILAMARGAGEVAPLMITGVVKLAPALPVDGTAPFIHAERKFMHLGFHIYDLGFQSPDSEAAKPMVFATTLLLILLVIVLNLLAIHIRTRLRQKFQASAF